MFAGVSNGEISVCALWDCHIRTAAARSSLSTRRGRIYGGRRLRTHYFMLALPTLHSHISALILKTTSSFIRRFVASRRNLSAPRRRSETLRRGRSTSAAACVGSPGRGGVLGDVMSVVERMGVLGEQADDWVSRWRGEWPLEGRCLQ